MIFSNWKPTVKGPSTLSSKIIFLGGDDFLEEVDPVYNWSRVYGDLKRRAAKIKKEEKFVNDEYMPLEEAVQTLISRRHSSKRELIELALYCVSDDFLQACGIKVFLIDVSSFCEILANDNLKIPTEVEVFRVALQWINHSLKDRKKYMSRVMQHVRFPCMTEMELFECLQATDLMKGHSEMIEVITEANWVATARSLGINDPLDIQIPTPITYFS